MRLVYRIATAFVPPPRNAWIRAHEAELDFIDDRSGRLRWMLGVVPLGVISFARLLVHQPAILIGGTLVKTIVTTLSIVNVAAGIGLGVLYVTDTNPPVVAVLGAVLVIQGAFTLALLSGTFGDHRGSARHVQLTGSTLSVVVGSIGLVSATLANLAPTSVDPEYGPAAVAMLLVIHGLFSILAFARGDTDPSTLPQVR